MTSTELTSEDREMAAPVGALSPVQSASSSRRSSMYQRDEQSDDKLPESAYYIIILDGCEHFCFGGLQGILLLYFMQYFHMSETDATADYHIFSSIYHFTPLVGAIIADGFLGRYSTIVILAIVYLIGAFILSITTIPKIGHMQLIGPVLGLFLIAVGAGGMKPCLSTFGGDQIPKSNMQLLNHLFSTFYLVTQIAALVSRTLTPLLRSDVQCFGYDCYPLAFSVSSCAILFGIILFIIGTPLYKRIPRKDNVIAQFAYIIWRALRNRIFRSKTETKEHLLYHADDKYSKVDIDEVRLVLRVLLLFLPNAVFQALQSQKGSRWTLQASLMSGNLGPLFTLQPDQMQVLSFALVLLFIPLFNRVIYPAAARFNWLLQPLQRIFLGLILTGIAFVIAAILQETIERKEDAVPVRYFTDVYNGYHCSISINSDIQLPVGNIYQFSCTELQESKLSIASTCGNQTITYKLAKDKLCPSIIIIADENKTLSDSAIKLTPLTNPISRSRGVKQYALLRMAAFDNVTDALITITPNQYQFNVTGELEPTEYQTFLEATYRISTTNTNRTPYGSFYVRRTAVYTVLLVNHGENEIHTVLFEDVPPFTVHMFWQIFQYIFLASGDVLVNVTVLIFAYSEAPKRYKVIISSLWILTASLGDILVIVVAESHIARTQTGEFLFFAALMAFATYIFGMLAIHYEENRLFEDMDEPTEDQHLLTEQNTPH